MSLIEFRSSWVNLDVAWTSLEVARKIPTCLGVCRSYLANLEVVEHI